MQCSNVHIQMHMPIPDWYAYFSLCFDVYIFDTTENHANGPSGLPRGANRQIFSCLPQEFQMKTCFNSEIHSSGAHNSVVRSLPGIRESVGSNPMIVFLALDNNISYLNGPKTHFKPIFLCLPQGPQELYT